MKFVISDAHEGLKAAATKVLGATAQRCRVHFMRDALAHAGKSGRQVVSALIATAFAQDDAEAARQQWRRVADQFRPKMPKLAALVDAAGSPRLSRMFDTVQAETRLCLHLLMPGYRSSAEVAAEHRRLAALATGEDLAAALAELGRHLADPIRILRRIEAPPRRPNAA